MVNYLYSLAKVKRPLVFIVKFTGVYKDIILQAREKSDKAQTFFLIFNISFI